MFVNAYWKSEFILHFILISKIRTALNINFQGNYGPFPCVFHRNCIFKFTAIIRYFGTSWSFSFSLRLPEFAGVCRLHAVITCMYQSMICFRVNSVVYLISVRYLFVYNFIVYIFVILYVHMYINQLHFIDIFPYIFKIVIFILLEPSILIEYMYVCTCIHAIWYINYLSIFTLTQLPMHVVLQFLILKKYHDWSSPSGFVIIVTKRNVGHTFACPNYMHIYVCIPFVPYRFDCRGLFWISGNRRLKEQIEFISSLFFFHDQKYIYIYPLSRILWIYILYVIWFFVDAIDFHEWQFYHVSFFVNIW